MDSLLDGELNTHRDDRMVASPPPTAKKKSAPRGVLARKDTEDGPLEIFLLEDSLWYKAYVSNFLMLEPESSMAKKFRERFCLPYPNFLQLVVSVSKSKLFDKWCGHKWNNKQALPIELLVLGSLRYLGRGWTFHDVEENTDMGQQGDGQHHDGNGRYDNAARRWQRAARRRRRATRRRAAQRRHGAARQRAAQ